MRAVFARRAALLALLTGFLIFEWLVAFADVLLAGAGFFATCAVPSSGFFAGVFTAFLCAVATALSGAVAGPPEVCPTADSPIISTNSRAIRQREANAGTNFGEDETLISPL